MISKELAYKKALEIKKTALDEKRLRRSTLLSAAYASNPRLKELDSQLSGIGAQIAISALSGGSDAVEQLKKTSEALSLEKAQLLKKLNIENLSYDCPLCQDSGYINGKLCGCVKELAKGIISRELSAKMPIDECTFESFDLSEYPDIDGKEGNPYKRMSGILKLCREYADNFNPDSSPNLLFMGAAGLGKTHLSLAIAGEVIKKGYLPVYGPAENLFTTIEKERFSGFGAESDSYNSMISCDLLVIDDLGAEFMTSFSKSILYNLVNTRILAKKPTIINTNLSMKEIEKFYSPRISSRLIGSYDARKFLGNDIRQQKAMKG